MIIFLVSQNTAYDQKSDRKNTKRNAEFLRENLKAQNGHWLKLPVKTSPTIANQNINLIKNTKHDQIDLQIKLY